MPFSQLAAVRHRLAVGQPLPFNVLDADATLLLARGQRVQSCEQMEALFTRGALVDLAELRSPRELIAQAAPQQLPQLWNQCLEQVGQTLQQGAHEGFAQALDEVGAPVHALIERDPDLAIFQVLSRNGNAHTQYGADHSVHTAITAFLVAQRLGWDEAARHTVFKVALTMNLSMLELQGQLAEQTAPLTPEQREAIRTHPERGTRLHPALPYIEAEVIWAARWEMARTVEDVLARRTRALILNAKAAKEMAPRTAKLLASELGRDALWESQEVERFYALAQSYLPVR